MIQLNMRMERIKLNAELSSTERIKRWIQNAKEMEQLAVKIP